MVLALTLSEGVAFAQDPPFLSEQVTDLTGLLDERPETERALDELELQHGIQLWVLFVFTTGPRTVTDYTDAVAETNSFGGNDALLVVAIDDRSDGLWVGPLLDDVTDREIDQLLANELEPRLADGDFDGAVAAFAAGLGRAASPGEATPVPATPTPGIGTPGGTTSGEGGGISIFPILGVIGAAVAAIVGFRWFRRRTGRGGGSKTQRVDLDTRASQLLLEVDELLQDSREELGFAEAQYNEAEAKPFRDSVEKATAEMKAAFLIRQNLDDNIPEPPAERKAMLEQLIRHCETAKGFLEQATARVDELRALERAAPEILAGVPGLVGELERELPAGERQFQQLRTFAEPIWEPLEGNVEEARKRLLYAREAATAGTAAVAAGQSQEAAYAAREAQNALAEARTLLEAIDHQLEAANSAKATLPGELSAAETDAGALRAAINEGRITTGAEGLARVEGMLADARREANASRPDVFVALRLAQEANAHADSVLVQVREEQERVQKARAAYERKYARAEAAYQRAADYIFARRHGIGSEARTRLTEAERRLEQARRLQATDFGRATIEAEAAERMASEALRRARADFEGDDRGGGPPARPGGGGSKGTGSVLGGIAAGAVLGGLGRRSGGFGGTSWGSPGSGGGGFKMPSGGFGGGRTRGGRW